MSVEFWFIDTISVFTYQPLIYTKKKPCTVDYYIQSYLLVCLCFYYCINHACYL